MSPSVDSGPPPPPTAPHGWTVEVSTGDAGPFHNRPVPTPPTPTVWVHHVDRSALVLGSTQPEGVVDRELADADDVEVCRRRSGGGIVMLTPTRDCWIDVIVPKTSYLWSDDVGVAFDWLGAVWAATLASIEGLGGPGREPVVHRGPLEGGDAGRLVCFASLGPGEVTIAGHKVVGISQRRTREAARFQSVAIGSWEPDRLQRYLEPGVLAASGADLTAMRVGVDVPWPAAEVIAERFCARLPSAPDGRGAAAG